MSNTRGYLATHAPAYAGAPHDVDAAAVRDGHVITASGFPKPPFNER
jgi:hypothetical protein